MAKIALDLAPATALPRRFLLSMPWWGIAAGLLLLVDGDAALRSRWAPQTLALVHAVTLGLLGNAMCGSLLQFLPAALGARPWGGRKAGTALHVLLNAGALSLVLGLRTMRPALLLAAACTLALAFVLLAAIVLPGVLRASGPLLVRAGIAQAVLAALAAAGLGVAMAHGLQGRGLPAWPWINVHAGVGLVGWVLVLVASVAGVVMPMFQGTRTVPARAQAAWLALVALVLVVGAFSGEGLREAVLRHGGAAGVGAAVLAGLWLQARREHTRNPWLLRSWRLGFGALLAAAVALASGAPAPWIGVLALGIGFPALVVGMQLEIVAFLGWIDLYRGIPRGTRLPAVQKLLADDDKRRVFMLQLLAAAALPAACAWPPLARVAG
ncbi:MAG TPA: hypothetical protein VLM17_05100, partial [Xanthomonadaceae bacterium]|nr:hypothetical protein [Xanthomonadaceae bacterium]